MIPTVPPFIFGETNRTYFAQSLVSPSRNIEGRNLTSESRALCAEVHAKEMDTIKCWNSLVKYCCKFSGEFLVDCSDSKRISIFKLIGTPPVVEHTVFISDNFHVEAYRRQSKILTRDIINAFSNTVTKYSQIDHIINRLSKSIPTKQKCIHNLKRVISFALSQDDTRLFWKAGIAGSLIECERTLSNFFPCFNEGQKCCFFLF